MSAQFRLGDGSDANVTADGSVTTAIVGVAMFQERDASGELVTYYCDGPSDAEQQRHHAGVLQFMKSRQYRRAVRRLRPASTTCSTGRRRPRARRSGARRAAGPRSGNDPGDPDPPSAEPSRLAPPRAVRRFAAVRGLTVAQLRWCDVCGIVAFAIDAYQRAALDAIGFVRRCPDCLRRSR